jgi:small-conductance mechanosensitive channel
MPEETKSATNLLEFVEFEMVPYAIVVIVVAYVAGRLASQSLDALGERINTRRLLFKQVSAVTRFAILIVATVMVASSLFSFSQEALLAVGGSAAVAIGFAFKDLLASLMAGIILLFDRPFSVGDRINFDNTYGEVVEIGLRTVRVQTLDDNLVSIPNHLFLNQAVSSANAGALHQMCVFPFYLGCNENIGKAKRLIYEATASSRYVFLDMPITVVVREGAVPNGAERFAVAVTVKAYVFDGRYETAFGTDITERVKRAFQANGIRTAGEMEWLNARPA